MSSVEPVAIPDGITEFAGRKVMTDATGRYTPLEMIKPAELLQDESVRKIMGYAIGLMRQIERFKAHTMADLAALDSLLEQDYGLVKKGNRGKGNRTYMTYDTLFKVSVQVADYIDFGPELHIAKELLDECLNEWAAESRAELAAVVTRAFNTDKPGQVNRSEIFMLLRLEIADERWQRAMQAIREAMRIVGSKEYVRFAMREKQDDEWTAITINLAKA
ncbi:DUF3164 family protein [Pelagibacterium halotolerans]|uniref:Sulfate transporter n=1 Tax=Pelagibacterium halotolerans (strain DSM 22347 / JCM 15775 / CGMCC 1.7692 / B2) TaxID=1082931 RepID=G4RDF1_PELHB|nr:DUF3164 family protein [Pelagibacterium halotolerans]AEQ50777.1 hypothetical protein KKY_738 [Pelagibacterium halotolerans B2]QJR19306.1 DUF3164 family protein [Pelagibacterium halotolerans]SDZ95588.1 Protein of unknown function [Pelagibacterium halotolerans]